jgi:hypothetical protein
VIVNVYFRMDSLLPTVLRKLLSLMRWAVASITTLLARSVCVYRRTPCKRGCEIPFQPHREPHKAIFDSRPALFFISRVVPASAGRSQIQLVCLDVTRNDAAARETSFVNARLCSLSLGSLSLRYNSTWLTARRSASAAVPT